MFDGPSSPVTQTFGLGIFQSPTVGTSISSSGSSSRGPRGQPAGGCDVAAEHGCDLALMGAALGSGSQRNAQRHGIRIAYTRIKWRLTKGKS